MMGVHDGDRRCLQTTSRSNSRKSSAPPGIDGRAANEYRVNLTMGLVVDQSFQFHLKQGSRLVSVSLDQITGSAGRIKSSTAFGLAKSAHPQAGL